MQHIPHFVQDVQAFLRRTKKLLIPFFAGIFIIAILDQTAKFFAVGLLSEMKTIPLWKDVFHFTYHQNTGGAWGMLENHTWILTLVTFFIIVAVVSYMVFKRPKNKWLLTGITFIVGGAVGNLIDRVRLGYVIDFFDFTVIDFPIFNVADSFITIGAIIFCIYVIFMSDKKEN